MGWTVETLNRTVDKEIHALPDAARARFVRISDLITAVGLDQVGAPFCQAPKWAPLGNPLEGKGRYIAGSLRCCSQKACSGG